MNKLLAIGILGSALALAGNRAEAHDEGAYFVLGTIVGSVLNSHSVRHAPTIHYAPAPHYAARTHVYYPPPRKVVVHKHHYRERHYREHHYREHRYRPGKGEPRWKARQEYRHDSHRGKHRSRGGR